MKRTFSSLFVLSLAIAAFGQTTAPVLIDPNAAMKDGPATINANVTQLYKQRGQSGPTLPATCAVYDQFTVTAFIPHIDYSCVAANTWVPKLGSATFGGVPLLSPTLGPNAPAPVMVQLHVGDNDMYTAPSCTVGAAGCNRQLIGMALGAISDAGAMVYYGQIKHGGVYYPVGGGITGSAVNATVTAGGSNTATTAAPYFILDPGDTASIHVNSIDAGAAFNATLSRVAYDSSTPLKMFTLFAPQSGTNNAVYTAPAGKTGIILAAGGLPFRNSSVCSFQTDASVVSGTAVDLYLAPTGSSLSVANQFLHYFSGAGPQAFNISCPDVVPSGYTLYLKVGVNTTNAVMWGWVFEF